MRVFHSRTQSRRCAPGRAVDFFWRESLDDGIYGLGVNLLRSGLDKRNRYIGSQPSAGVYWQARRHIGLAAAFLSWPLSDPQRIARKGFRLCRDLGELQVLARAASAARDRSKGQLP